MCKCPLCDREIPLHHIEKWGNEKVIVWTIVCMKCLKNKNRKEI